MKSLLSNKKRAVRVGLSLVAVAVLAVGFQNCSSKVGIENTSELRAQKASVIAEPIASSNPALEVDDRLFDPIPPQSSEPPVQDESAAPQPEPAEAAPVPVVDNSNSGGQMPPAPGDSGNSGEMPGNPSQNENSGEAPEVVDGSTPGSGEAVVNSKKTAKLTLRGASRKADILLIIDNSGSMKEDALKLADKLKGFVDSLKGSEIDWQMCLTTTSLTNNQGHKLREWKSGVKVLNKSILEGMGNENIFSNAVEKIFASGGAGEERGVWVLSHFINSQDSKVKETCLREDAVFNSIVISDEDENSNGKNLSDKSKPDNLLDLVRTKFNSGKTYVHHSVVIRNDEEGEGCRLAQHKSTRTEGKRWSVPEEPTKEDQWLNWVGKTYLDLTQKTGGKSGSICADDYTPILSDITASVALQVGSVQLECEPKSIDSVKVAKLEEEGSALDSNLVSYEVKGQFLEIKGAPSEDIAVQVEYQCK